MEPAVRGDVVQFLFAGRGGGHDGLNRSGPLVYSELHSIANRRMHGQPPEPITPLIHEPWPRLAESTDLSFKAEGSRQRKCLAQLVHYPITGRMRAGMETQDPPPAVFDDEETIQNPKRQCAVP
jgi:hypothetical protein